MILNDCTSTFVTTHPQLVMDKIFSVPRDIHAVLQAVNKKMSRVAMRVLVVGQEKDTQEPKARLCVRYFEDPITTGQLTEVLPIDRINSLMRESPYFGMRVDVSGFSAEGVERSIFSTEILSVRSNDDIAMIRLQFEDVIRLQTV